MDKEIYPLIEATLDKKKPREWYYALMDYGFMLKKKYPELNKRSAHYRKQAPFKGSNREIRGNVLKLLLKDSTLSESLIIKKLEFKASRIRDVLNQLVKERFIKKVGNKYSII